MTTITRAYWIRVIGRTQRSDCGTLVVILGQYDDVLATALVDVLTYQRQLLATGVSGPVAGHVPPELTQRYRIAYQPKAEGALMAMVNELGLAPRHRTGRQRFALPC